MNALQLAGVLPKNPRFREWAQQFIAKPVDETDAAWLIRDMCEVQSRRDIATNPDAAARFHHLIRKPFVEWCEQLQEPA